MSAIGKPINKSAIDKTQTPIRQFPRWKRGRGDLNHESGRNDVSGGNAIYFSPLHFLEEAAHG